jgi:hypothetical protein
LWPRFIEARFAALLDLAEKLIALPAPGVKLGAAVGALVGVAIRAGG